MRPYFSPRFFVGGHVTLPQHPATAQEIPTKDLPDMAADQALEPTQSSTVQKRHLWDSIILTQIVGSMMGVQIRKTFTQVEIKPEMTDLPPPARVLHRAYKPMKRGWPSLAATRSYHFVPLK